MYAEHERKENEEKTFFYQKRKIKRLIRVAASWKLLK